MIAIRHKTNNNNNNNNKKKKKKKKKNNSQEVIDWCAVTIEEYSY